MPDIRTNLKAINKEIQDLKSSAQEAGKSARELGQDMRLDPSNINLVLEKYNRLEEQLKSNVALLEKYKQAETEINQALKGLDPKSEEFIKLTQELEKYQKAADRTQKTISNLSAATSDLAKNTELAKAKTQEIRSRYEQAEIAAEKYSRAVIVLVGALTLLVKTSLDSANNLYTLSKRYNTSVESIQRYNNELYIATGQTELYNNALSVMTKGMAQIAAGRGVAYETALRNIGLSSAALAGKTTAEQYMAIFEALQRITDATERAAAAQTLFGDSGMYIAQAAGMSIDEWEKIVEQAEKFAVVSTQDVEALQALNLEFQQAKSQLSAVAMELTVSLTPALIALASIVTEVVVPILDLISEGMERLGPAGQYIVGLVLLGIAVLPKLIALVGAFSTYLTLTKMGIDATTISVAGLNIVAAKWQIILLAVSAVILGLVALVGAFNDEAQDSIDKANQAMMDTNNMLGNAGVDVSSSTESYTSSMSERNVNIQVDITGRGETSVSDASASQVALITMNEIQKKLGALTK